MVDEQNQSCSDMNYRQERRRGCCPVREPSARMVLSSHHQQEHLNSSSPDQPGSRCNHQNVMYKRKDPEVMERNLGILRDALMLDERD